MKNPIKRRERNRENLLEFFAGQDKYEQKRAPALRTYPPKLTLELIHMLIANEVIISHLAAYKRRFKQAASEIDESDIEYVAQLLGVKEIMDA